MAHEALVRSVTWRAGFASHAKGAPDEQDVGAERTMFPDGLAGLRLGHLRARLPEGYAITGQILLEDVVERTDVPVTI
jgi:hypothetical protein